jgi:hypothetical protein
VTGDLAAVDVQDLAGDIASRLGQLELAPLEGYSARA